MSLYSARVERPSNGYRECGIGSTIETVSSGLGRPWFIICGPRQPSPPPQQPLMRNRSEGVGIVCRGLSGQVGLVFTPCSPHLPYHLSSCVGVYTRPAPTGPRQPGGSGSTAASPLRLCHLWVGILIPLPNGGGTSDFRIRSTTSHIQLDGVWRNHT